MKQSNCLIRYYILPVIKSYIMLHIYNCSLLSQFYAEFKKKKNFSLFSQMKMHKMHKKINNICT